MIQLRKSADRGYADHGWLQSHHSFSFAHYYDAQHMGFGSLRVMNDDWIAANSGFDTHGHRDMEIITYLLQGELTHKDSMGNGSRIVAGDVQYMSAGRGVMHSEFNLSQTDQTHLLQIWIEPQQKGGSPSYSEKHFDHASKRGQLRLLISGEAAQDSIKIGQDVRLFAGLFDGDEQYQLPLQKQRKAYVHLARGSLIVNGHRLDAGDAAMLTDEPSISLAQGKDAEVLVFDLP